MICFTLIGIFTFAIFIHLGIFVLIQNPKSRINRTFLFLCLCFAIWSLFDTLRLFCSDKKTLMIYTNLSSIGWIFFPAIALYFYHNYSGYKTKITNSLIFVPSIIFFLRSFFVKNIVVKDFIEKSFGYAEILATDSLWFYSYIIYYLTYIAGSLIIAIKESKKTYLISEKTSLRIVAFSMLFCISAGTITNVILPSFKIYLFSPVVVHIFTLLWSFIIFYTIIKYKHITLTPKDTADTILASIGDSVIVFDKEGNIKFINNATNKLLGYTQDELIGKKFDFLLAEKIQLNFENFKNNKAIEIHDARYKTKTGEIIPVSINITCIKENDGNIAGIVTVAKDLREIKKIENQLSQSEKMIAVGQLAAGTAHELNNPLTTILGLTQLILNDLKKDNPLYSDIKEIETSALKCKEIIENMLTFARQKPVSQSHVNVNEILDHTLSLLNYQIKIQEIKVVKIYEENLKPVYVSPNEIQQVFLNIIINAVQAMPSGGTLKVETKNQKNNIQIKISDTGVGIKKENLKYIFNPFWTTKETGKGTGLGLSVSYSIIKKYNGTIEAESEGENKGASFIIKLPLSD